MRRNPNANSQVFSTHSRPTRPIRPIGPIRPIALACILALAAAQANAADSLPRRLSKANEILNAGNAAGAMEKYRELLTEDPESPVLHYNIGLANYNDALKLGEAGSAQDAIAALEKAGEAFAQAQKNAQQQQLRDSAAFAHANSEAQKAKVAAGAVAAQQGVISGGEMQTPQALYDTAVASFQTAVKEYEDLLKLNPDHPGARQNLDHVRYLLKSLLQNPPPPQEQQQQQQKGDQQQDQDSEKQEQQNPDEQPDPQEQQPQEQQQQQPQQQQEPQDRQQDQNQAQSQDAPQANVEALLQSLEEIDEREQREVKDPPQPGNTTQGNWW